MLLEHPATTTPTLINHGYAFCGRDADHDDCYSVISPSAGHTLIADGYAFCGRGANYCDNYSVSGLRASHNSATDGYAICGRANTCSRDKPAKSAKFQGLAWAWR